MRFIGLDLGTSFIKGAVLDLDRLTLSHIRRQPFPEPISGLPALFYEIEPEKVVVATRLLLEELLALAPDCAGVVMCSQMHGLVLTTAQGEARSNCITWQDQRVLQPHPSGEGSYFEVLSSRLTLTEQRQLGNELKPSLPLCYLFWLAEEGRLPSEAVIPAALPDFVLARLSGTRPSIEVTNAASHGALNLETLDWHHEVITKLNLAHLQWPIVQPFGKPVAQIQIDSTTLPCYTPVGDHQCAITGAFLEEGELSLNIATASQVTMLTSHLQPGSYQTRPFFDGRFMNTIARIPAGRSLNVLINLLSELAQAQQLQLSDPWPYIAEAVAATPETGLRVDLSFFASSVGYQGQITNIQEDNLTIGHLFRAAFQNMTDNYHTCALRLSPTPTWRSLVFSGGLVQKITPLQQMICQKFADAPVLPTLSVGASPTVGTQAMQAARTTQVDHRLSASLEDTLLGLLALALVASGRQPSVASATAFLRQAYIPAA